MPSAKKRVPVVPAKVKAAVEHLFENPKADLEAAAKVAGLSTYRLREEMKKPHVSRYVWNEKRARLEALCAQNPAALKDIRDNSDNAMARVAAIKTAEQLRAEIQETTRGGGASQSPGFVIVIAAVNGAPARIIGPLQTPPMIEHASIGDDHAVR